MGRLTSLLWALASVCAVMGQTADKDFGNLNTLLEIMILPLTNLTIEPKFVEAGPLTLVANFGDSGTCEDFKVLDGGDIRISADFLDGQFDVNGTLFEKYEVDLTVEVLQFQCTINIVVQRLKADGTTSGDPEFGLLTFRSQNLFMNQKIDSFSPDFTTVPPVLAMAGNCTADPGLLTFSGTDLGTLGGQDITAIILATLEDDPSLVTEDVVIELCKLGADMADLFASLLVSENLADVNSSFYTFEPFKPNANGDIFALGPEKRMVEAMEDQGQNRSELLNLTDQTNFFVNMIIPDDPSQQSFISTLLEFFVDPEGESDLDPILLLIEDVFEGVTLLENGTVLGIDLLAPLIESGVTLGLNQSIHLNNTLFVDIEFSVTKLSMDLFPPIGSPILPSFQALGEQTLLMDPIDFGRFKLDIGFSVKLKVENNGIPGNPFLGEPFDILIDEPLGFSIDWDGLDAGFAMLFPINLEDIYKTQIVPFYGNWQDCTLAFFQQSPVITGATLGNDALDIGISNLNDAILVLIEDIFNVVIPVYEPVFPRALELALADLITGTDFIDPTECPTVPIEFDDVEKFPYDFSTGFINALSEVMTVENLNLILDLFQIEDFPIFILGNEEGTDPGVGFTIPVPPQQGWTQNVTVYLQEFVIRGLIPPILNDLVVLQAIPDSEHFPQDLRIFIDAGNVTNEVSLTVLFNVTAHNAFHDEESIGDLVDPENPPEFFEFSENLLYWTFYFSDVQILLDVFGRYSLYDIESFGLGELINLGCWGEKLNYPGGVSQFAVGGQNVTVVAECNCTNPVMKEMLSTLQQNSTFDAQFETIVDILNRFGDMVEDLFHIDHFEHTQRIAGLICETRDWDLIQLPIYDPHPYHTSFGAILPLFALFLFAVVTPCCFVRMLNNYGPELHKVNKHKQNHELNEKAVAKKEAAEENADVDRLESLHLLTPMYKNPLIPAWAKAAVPFLLLGNVVLFIVSNAGPAVQIDVDGHVFLIPYQAERFRTLSVVSSVFELFKSGGWLLGILLFCMSIAWPYVKLFIMAYCWFRTPEILPVTKRGKILEFLDFMGRFSFAEFHFLIFILVVFQIEAGTPDLVFLPTDDMFLVLLEIKPLVSLFTFSLAVVVSIILSNAMLVWQHNIEDETRIKLRESHLENRKDQNLLLTEARNRDSSKIKLVDWKFNVFEKDEDGMIIHNYIYEISSKATYLVAGTVITAMLFLVLAATIPSLEVEMFGFFAYLVFWAGSERKFGMSVLQLLIRAYDLYQGNYIIYLVGLIFFATITIIPLVQTILLCVLLFKPVSVKTARKLAEAHHVVTVWCCVDVFTIALVLTVLELPVVAEGLAARLNFCESLGSVMEGFLEPMGFISQADVDAGCFSMRSYLGNGSYLGVISVFVLNMANIIVSRMFYRYVASREAVVEMEELENELKKGPSTEAMSSIKPWHETLQRFGLVKLSAPGQLSTSQQMNPMYDDYGPPSQGKSKRNTKAQSKLPSSFNPMFDESQVE